MVRITWFVTQRTFCSHCEWIQTMQATGIPCKAAISGRHHWVAGPGCIRRFGTQIRPHGIRSAAVVGDGPDG